MLDFQNKSYLLDRLCLAMKLIKVQFLDKFDKYDQYDKYGQFATIL